MRLLLLLLQYVIHETLVNNNLRTLAENEVALFNCSYGFNSVPQVTQTSIAKHNAEHSPEVKYGLGKHFNALTSADFQEVLKVK